MTRLQGGEEEKNNQCSACWEGYRAVKRRKTTNVVHAGKATGRRRGEKQQIYSVFKKM
jgi:hypothetical protein